VGNLPFNWCPCHAPFLPPSLSPSLPSSLPFSLPSPLTEAKVGVLEDIAPHLEGGRECKQEEGREGGREAEEGRREGQEERRKKGERIFKRVNTECKGDKKRSGKANQEE
jgi:hypothetical protein